MISRTMDVHARSASVPQLFSIKGATERCVDLGHPPFLIKLNHPLGCVPMHCRIRLFQHTEIRARRDPTNRYGNHP